MRIAVLSDTHGNAFAVEAVIRDIQAHAPDAIVNLGDQIWGQANPLRALELQRELGAIEVRGNNDELLVLPPRELPAHKQLLGKWLTEQLPPLELERLANLPTTAALANGEIPRLGLD